MWFKSLLVVVDPAYVWRLIIEAYSYLLSIYSRYEWRCTDDVGQNNKQQKQQKEYVQIHAKLIKLLKINLF